MRYVLSNVTTWPAARIATAIRAREISCEEIVRAYLARIEEVNPKLNAVVQLCLERALTEARNDEKTIARNELVGPSARSSNHHQGQP